MVSNCWRFHCAVCLCVCVCVCVCVCLCADTVEESEVEVQDYEGPCEFDSDVHYVDNAGHAVDISQLIPLVDSSTSCRQLVKWRCLAATINSPNSATGGATRLTNWKNRGGQHMGYWGGASPVPVGRYFLSPCIPCCYAAHLVVSVLVSIINVVQLQFAIFSQ